MKKYVLDAGILLVLGIAGFLYLNAARTEGDVPKELSAPLVVLDADGNDVAIHGRSNLSRVLVLFFQENCWACVEQYPSWLSLIPVAERSGVPVVGISTLSNDFSAPRQLQRVPIYTIRSLSSLQQSLPLLGVPTTVLLEPRGEISFYHRGVLPAEKRSELNDLLTSLEK